MIKYKLYFLKCETICFPSVIILDTQDAAGFDAEECSSKGPSTNGAVAASGLLHMR